MKKSTILLLFLVFFASISSIFLLQKGTFRSNNDTSVTTGKSYNPVEYTPTDLESLLEKQSEKYVVIDARTRLEYDKGHVPGALHADYYDSASLIQAAGSKIPITYDAFSSMRGPYAAYQLYQAGYKNVGILYGGLTAWAEDIQQLDSTDGQPGSVFMHPKNIFPEKVKAEYPANKGTVEFNIVAKRFSFKPNQIVVQHGQKVILHVVSRDVIHGFALPEFNIEEELLPNLQKEITFIANRKGNFTFITNVVSGRDYASMVGNIIVN
ncbi:hypothetical protein A3C98_02750 [Candidatus Roizmanbacteria bacterium RIFCSPHIGHO2_02_FULL_37_15]|uniref:Rhodanese domain-containing protein n=1 Tax=Candidatus Roizmanbacteria bacterium RIFCSPLOWO2_01_FULL_37_16 TaxID=1802058 RepID=A0A1F7IM11_9BACT|nr:MAG: hypothetical protein A2859_05695 [Candidatus Roizmanbacteria bacterium RIFCSPHIGHO2_01_FULL_37_16b]OGK22807.1 MAG: hypothetical protein A3C98_02750 [Candidatus Roizmanbacteria bacterium RIFCSPHIGHO2_02_FULL_37_15]OGK44419.1 MAG: hypothetical protein A3B40_02700 [Candidatus Roizmanbacteria bacterium RIFCSPLOWO2_01_FULL_37_16]